MLKRLFDLIFSILGLMFLSPLFLIFSILILIDSKGNVFYIQQRVGKNSKDFKLFKFRTMAENSDKAGLLTIGNDDNRITNIGSWLRRYKLDELPQLINIFIGDMSFVGPRPEVRKYVDLYNYGQLKVLAIKPGLTDYASLKYINESEILASYSDPEKAYIDKIMPEKLALNLQYIKQQSFLTDIKILAKTVVGIIN